MLGVNCITDASGIFQAGISMSVSLALKGLYFLQLPSHGVY